jgi:FHA domain
MTDRGEEAPRPPRAPMPRRTRRRWAVAAGLAACWALLLALTGSIVDGTALVLFFLALGAGCVLALRAMGVNAAHPWVHRIRSRPWRDGQDVLQLGLRHLPDVFVMTPGGTLLAPNAVELSLNPRELGSLSELMDIGLVDASATEVYEEQVAVHGARFARPGVAQVWVAGDPSVPVGRYRLRQARQVDGVPAVQPAPEAHLVPAGGWPYAHDGYTRDEPASAAGAVTGLPTVAERGELPVPALRLITCGSVAETRTPAARAGRGDVELVLPQVPTISREHARFSYTDGQWWVTNLGRNGLTVNGVPLEGRRPVRDGDSIGWGSKAEAPVSRVEVG